MTLIPAMKSLSMSLCSPVTLTVFYPAHQYKSAAFHIIAQGAYYLHISLSQGTLVKYVMKPNVLSYEGWMYFETP